MTYSKTLKSLLLAAAILAPATTLAVMGWRAYRAEALLLRERYRQDRAAIVQLVAGRLSESARKALEDLEARTSDRVPDGTLEARFRAAHPLARHIFLVRGGRVVYPAFHPSDRSGVWSYDYRSRRDEPYYLARENERMGVLVARGLRAEHNGQLQKARRLYLWASRSRTGQAARALLGLGRVERKTGRLKKARRHLRSLHTRFGGRRDAEGVSYALLAHAGLVEVGGEGLGRTHLLRIHRRLLKGEYRSDAPVRKHYLRWVVDRLAHVPGLSKKQLGQLRRITASMFASERFGALLHRHNAADELQRATPQTSGVALDRRTTLVMRRDKDEVLGFTVDEDYLSRQVAQHQQKGTSQARGLQLALRRVGDAPRRPNQRLLFSTPLDQPLSHWTIATYVPKTDPMDLLERRGGLRRLGLVVGLILALSVGLVLTYRGVRRESELARLKSDFASNVSHELKTPLTSIRMYAEMLEQGIAGTAEDRGRYQRVIIRESERLGRLIANVLDFSRVERGTRRYELQSENLADLTGEAVDTFRRLAEGEEIRVELTRGNRLPKVNADREAAVQSILNLLSNAAKYSPDEHLIEVELLQRDGQVGVEVRDQGIGIPPAEQKRIFDDFYRAPDSRRVGVEGTGLGLALVRRHMKACGGSVELQSEQGKGSRFTLWFPRATEQPESEHV